MQTFDAQQLGLVLEAHERVVAAVRADGFFASEHNVPFSANHVALSDKRLVVLSERGMLKKRLTIEASWPLQGFTTRINSNEGTALGPFLHFLTLFTTGEETVSTAFRQSADRDAFKELVVKALEHNG
jgi:hypothetical protein